MSGTKDSGGVFTCKKGVRHSALIPPVYVCPHLIRQVQETVPGWGDRSPTKIAGILTRALPDSDLRLSGRKKTFKTAVILSIPGGQNKVFIPLEIEDRIGNKVQLSLDPDKKIKFISGPPARETHQMQT